jgi:hypothetical protein
MVNQNQIPLTTAEKGILLQSVLDEVFDFGPLGPILSASTDSQSSSEIADQARAQLEYFKLLCQFLL